jgi:hypothetical protein
MRDRFGFFVRLWVVSGSVDSAVLIFSSVWKFSVEAEYSLPATCDYRVSGAPASIFRRSIFAGFGFLPAGIICGASAAWLRGEG